MKAKFLIFLWLLNCVMAQSLNKKSYLLHYDNQNTFLDKTQNPSNTHQSILKMETDGSFK